MMNKTDKCSNITYFLFYLTFSFLSRLYTKKMNNKQRERQPPIFFFNTRWTRDTASTNAPPHSPFQISPPPLPLTRATITHPR